MRSKVESIFKKKKSAGSAGTQALLQPMVLFATATTEVCLRGIKLTSCTLKHLKLFFSFRVINLHKKVSSLPNPSSVHCDFDIYIAKICIFSLQQWASNISFDSHVLMLQNLSNLRTSVTLVVLQRMSACRPRELNPSVAI